MKKNSKTLILIIMLVMLGSYTYSQSLLSMVNTKDVHWDYDQNLGRFAHVEKERLKVTAPNYNTTAMGSSENFVVVYFWVYVYKNPITGKVKQAHEHNICTDRDCNEIYLPVTTTEISLRVSLVSLKDKNPLVTERLRLFTYKWNEEEYNRLFFD